MNRFSPDHRLKFLFGAVLLLPAAPAYAGETEVPEHPVAGLLRDRRRRGLLDLHIHDYFSDDELWDYALPDGQWLVDKG